MACGMRDWASAVAVGAGGSARGARRRGAGVGAGVDGACAPVAAAAGVARRRGAGGVAGWPAGADRGRGALRAGAGAALVSFAALVPLVPLAPFVPFAMLGASCCWGASVCGSSIGIAAYSPLIHRSVWPFDIGMMGANHGAVWRRRHRSAWGAHVAHAVLWSIFAPLDGPGPAPVTSVHVRRAIRPGWPQMSRQRDAAILAWR